MSKNKPMKRCYVVQPWGQPGTPRWLRARQVLKEYIEPACQQAGYQPESFHNDVTTDLVAVNKYHLERAPMVIADLADPPWNENVMMEVGYRFVSKKPIVLIRDTPETEQEDLPFLLRPYRVIQLPPDSPDLGHDLATELKNIAITNIVKLLKWEEKKYHSWHSAHAMAVVEIDCETMWETYVEANAYAKSMLSPNGNSMLGVPGEEITSRVLSWMPPKQIEPFKEDQGRVYEELFSGDTEVTSTIPLVFSQDHPDEQFHGRAYKPLIIQNETFERDDGSKTFYVRVLYLDVTNSVWKDDNEVWQYAESGRVSLNRKSHHPLCVIKFDLSKKQSVLFDANLAALEMMKGLTIKNGADGDAERETLKGQSGQKVAKRISKWMPKPQAKSFLKDQDRIYEEIFHGKTDVVSELPIYFSNNHPNDKFRSKAFCPLLVHHEHIVMQDKTARLYACVLFVDVTNSVKVCDDEYHYADCGCPKCNERPQQATAENEIDVLLCYDPSDRDFVAQIYEKLSEKTPLKVWFDAHEKNAGRKLTADRVNSALSQARSVIFFYGDEGQRGWWETCLANPMIEQCQKKNIEIIYVWLPTAGELPKHLAEEDVIQFESETDGEGWIQLVNRLQVTEDAMVAPSFDEPLEADA